MCQSSSPNHCNRQPFFSESGCYRGSVDIHQFDDLPYCGTVSPTPPSIPPEIASQPASIPIPMYTCSCVNIKYDLDFKYDNSSSNEVRFRADGDCCEGNYITNFKLRIPCPVHSPENRRIKVGIEYGSGPNEVSASFLGANSSSCTIEALSPELHLNIPCPIQANECARLADGVTIPSKKRDGNGGFIPLRNDELIYSYYLVSGSWTPPGGGTRHVCARWKVEGPDGQEVEFGKQECNPNSELIAIRSNVDLTIDGVVIPKEEIFGRTKLLKVYCNFSTIWTEVHSGKAPSRWIGKGRDDNFRLGIGYGSGPRSASAKLFNIDSSSCRLSLNGASLHLNIPCPVQKNGIRRIVAKVKYGIGSSSASDSFASVGSSCSIKLKEKVRLNLSIPCPVQKNGIRRIVAKVKYGIGSSSASDSFASVGSQCSIKLKEEVRLNLSVPCPIKNIGKRVIKASVRYGKDPLDASDSFASVGSSCSIKLKDEVTLNLRIPCPASNSRLDIVPSFTTGQTANFYVASDNIDDNCKRTIKLKTVFPTPPPQKLIKIEAGSCTNLDVQQYSSSGTICYRIGVYYV